MGAPGRLRILIMLAFLAATSIHAQLWETTPTNLATWADLDAAVSNTYAGFSCEFMIYPPGGTHFGLGGAFCTFSPNGELAALTNLCTCTMQLGVPTWKMNVTETHTSPRAWLYIGTSGNAFRTNPCPSSYNPTQWVRSVWNHDVPGYLNGTNVDQWYADRDRNRFVLTSTFVNSNDWPTLQAAMHAAATNAPHSEETWVPSIPADSNTLTFIDIQSMTAAIDLWIYSPTARPVAVLANNDLLSKRWTVLGSFGAVPPFNLWQAADNGSSSMFYRAGFIDVNYSGNGIPDFIGAFVLGTDTNCFDSTGSPLGDYVRVMIYGLDPLSNSTVGDGITDTWKILNGIDPFDPTAADQDPDGDGIGNRIEFLLGTNPYKTSTVDSSNAATLRTATPMHR